LLAIHRDARTYLKEQGVDVLFLALGLLHWCEAPSSLEERRAPLGRLTKLTPAQGSHRWGVPLSPPTSRG
jgi:hypothetical protein